MKIFEKKFSKDKLILIYLLLLIIIAGIMRFYNLNWDEGHFFHPDERNIALAVTRISFFDKLNPRFFAYGSFPIYLYRAIADIVVKITDSSLWVSEWPYINIIGRSVSAFFSTISIILVFLLAKKIWNKKVAVLSSFFFAFSPFLIQLAHFSITESLLIFELLLILLLSLKISLKKEKARDYFFLAVALGIALSTKTSALSFFVVPLLGFLIRRPSPKYFILTGLLTIFVFSSLSPFIFLDSKSFLESMHYESGVVRGTLKVPYTYQFESTRAYLFQLKNFFFQMGPVAFFGGLGIIALIFEALKEKNKKLFLFLIFPICYFFYVGSWHTKFIRYMAPVLPFLAISASFFLLKIKKKFKVFGQILIFLSLLSTAIWGFSFFSIYTKEQTRITASKWVFGNIKRGSVILQEHWDDGLPIDIGKRSVAEYKTEALTLYELDNREKAEYLSLKLTNADYILINSRRLYGTLIDLEDIFPLTSRYYKLLFKGDLGYQLEKEFSSYPNFFGIEINDDLSEETFQVYDHPKVLLFKNEKRFSQEELFSLLWQ